MDMLYLECQYGVITSLADQGVGINSYKIKHRDACKVDDQLFGNKKCSDIINLDKFKAYFESECRDKQRCQMNLKENPFFRSTQDAECLDLRSSAFV